MSKRNTHEDIVDKLIVLENDCWVFTGSLNNKGYGNFALNGKLDKAHRVAYEYYIGPIPENTMVLHRCDNPPCCNPNHLFLGTAKDNYDDMIGKERQNLLHGANNGNATLAFEEADYIRSSKEPTSALALKYRVSTTTIKRIRSGRTYK